MQLTDDPIAVATRDPIRSAPRIAYFPGEDQPQYFLFVEKEVLCITPVFSQALMLWFVAHYVFNLEYCIKIKEVALFVQEFIFKLPATSGMKRQKTATYLSVTTDIQNYSL